jgi:hypothetical protein
MKKFSSETSKLSLNEIIDENLTAMVALWPRDLSGPTGNTLIKIWHEALSDLSLEQAIAAFARLRKEFKPTSAAPFPSPAHLLDFIEDANHGTLLVEANSAWDNLLNWIRRFYSVDIGITRRATELDAKTWAASKVAGGLSLLATCPTEDLVWRKKEFIEFYTTLHDTGRAAFLATDSEAKIFLRQLAGGEIKGFVPSKPARETELKLAGEIIEEAREDPPSAPVTPPPALAKRPYFKVKTSTMSLEEQKAELRKRGFIA